MHQTLTVGIDAPLRERVAARREGHADLRILALDRAYKNMRRADKHAAALETIHTADQAVPPDLGHRILADMERAWLHHIQLRELLEPGNSETVRNIAQVSWLGFCRLAVLNAQAHDSAGETFSPWPSCFERHARDYDYVQNLAGRRQLELWNACIGTYPAHIVLTAARILCEALDKFGWSPSAGQYLEALFLRYAMYLLLEDDGELAYEADGPEEIVNPACASPLVPGGRLTPSFVVHGERLFFHHLWRHRALLHYLTKGTSPAPKFAAGDPFQTSLLNVLEHPIIASSVAESIQKQILDMFLWPGEREHLLFDYAEEMDTDSDTVLFRLRPDAYADLRQLQEASLPDLVREYTSVGTDAAPLVDQLEAAVCTRQTAAERIVMVALEVCLNESVRSMGGHARVFSDHAYTDNRAAKAPADRPPMDVAAARAALPTEAAWPLFIAIWGVYIILSPVREGVTVTADLPTAAAVWLRDCVPGMLDERRHLAIFGTQLLRCRRDNRS